MRPAAERRVLDALEQARADLDELAAPLLEALARDDEPSGRDDAVAKRTRKLAATVLATAKGAERGLAFARYCATAQASGRGRQASVPPCVACDKPATPRPRRGLCGECHDAFTASDFVDVQAFARGTFGKSGTMGLEPR